ncbi:MAG: hypothetical protein V1709_01530 [Planctomycetota bacterium]
MICINLLPPERQRKERIPLPRFLAMNAAIIICALLLIWNVYQYRETKQQSAIYNTKKEDLESLLKKVELYDQMLVDETELNKWNKTAAEIKNTRSFLWWEKIDELWDVIHSSHDIWITSLQALDGPPPGRRADTKIEASISMNCLAAGSSSDRMTSFRIELKNHPGLKETFNLGLNEPPQFQVIAQPEYKEESAVKFDIDLAKELKVKK